jgi:hypothetical protein
VLYQLSYQPLTHLSTQAASAKLHRLLQTKLSSNTVLLEFLKPYYSTAQLRRSSTAQKRSFDEAAHLEAKYKKWYAVQM